MTKIEILHKRAELLIKLRSFFYARHILEVETPILAATPNIDRHIEPVQAELGYLVTSPEYFLKRMLCQGYGDIYSLGKVVRKHEVGRYHNPEFTMLEWYRLGFDEFQLMDEVDQLLMTLLESQPAERISYDDLFIKYLGVDPHQLTRDQFIRLCERQEQPIPESLLKREDRDAWLDLIMGLILEPQLAPERPLFIYHYPKSQAALSEVEGDIARRFEVYYHGIELGNGYFELRDTQIQQERFKQVNQERIAAGLKALPIDHQLAVAMKQGLPSCAGVAMGFDRLIMIALDCKHINEVISFPSVEL